MAEDVLSNGALNRALLARQGLLTRGRDSVPKMLGHLVGLQAQEPKDPYVGLWSRLHGFKPEKLGKLLESREAARLVLMRSTLHLVTASDALALRPLVQPVIDRSLQGSWGRHLVGLDLDAVAEAGRRLLAREPLTFAEVGTRLVELWPGRDGPALAQVVRARVPLVQVPPRGVWGKSGLARHSPSRTWLGDADPPTLDLEGLVLRYLAAFGPASVQDAQAWSGLTKLKAVFEKLRPQLVTFAAPNGKLLFDIPKAPRPDADTPAPPRFLPVYDNLVLGHRDRERMVSPSIRLPPVPENAIVRYVLVDGVLGATWELDEENGAATLTVKPFVRLSAADRAALQEEGARLLEFAAPDATGKSVRVARRARPSPTRSPPAGPRR